MTCRRQSRSAGGLYLESTKAEQLGLLPGEDRPVREVMNRRMTSVAPRTPLWEAASYMRQERSGSLLVQDDGRLHGLLSDRDIALGLATGQSGSSTVGALLQGRAVVTVCEDDLVADGWAVLKRHGLDAVPVLDSDGVVTGVLSWVDLAASVQPDSAAAWLREVRPQR